MSGVSTIDCCSASTTAFFWSLRGWKPCFWCCAMRFTWRRTIWPEKDKDHSPPVGPFHSQQLRGDFCGNWKQRFSGCAMRFTPTEIWFSRDAGSGSCHALVTGKEIFLFAFVFLRFFVVRDFSPPAATNPMPPAHLSTWFQDCRSPDAASAFHSALCWR